MERATRITASAVRRRRTQRRSSPRRHVNDTAARRQRRNRRRLARVGVAEAGVQSPLPRSASEDAGLRRQNKKESSGTSSHHRRSRAAERRRGDRHDSSGAGPAEAVAEVRAARASRLRRPSPWRRGGQRCVIRDRRITPRGHARGEHRCSLRAAPLSTIRTTTRPDRRRRPAPSDGRRARSARLRARRRVRPTRWSRADARS